jgi:U4/U6 small nuclear ribonucleoprotein PRP3
LHPELEQDPVYNPFFDDRVAFDKKKLVRPRRPSFQFVEEGKWSKQAEMQKLRVSKITWPFSCFTICNSSSTQVFILFLSSLSTVYIQRCYIDMCTCIIQAQYGEAKAKEMKMKQAAMSKAKAEADINPNLIEVSERVPVKEEKVKDPIPYIEWW